MKSIISKTILLLDMIKFEHTIFALPFAYLGAFLAARGVPDVKVCFLILLGMAGARTAAMGFNRIVDMPFDAKNPRTQTRALPAGKVKKAEAWAMVLISAFVYFFAAFKLNWLALILSPFVLSIILFYSYTKRFTPFCHVFLGLALGISPTAGWIAVKGEVSSIPIVLSFGVLFWVAGFDILYACLDRDFDVKTGLHSIPARFGIKNAFFISAFFHGLAFFFFLTVGFMASLNWIYYLGIVVTFLLFILQRLVVSPDNLSKMNMAFFTFNGAISMVLFLSTAFSLAFPI